MKTSTFLSPLMDHPSARRHSISYKRNTNNSSPFKPKTPFSNDTTVIWSNVAFVSDHDERSSMGSNAILSSPMKDNKKKREFFAMHVNEEELRLREELAKEVERELEREIIEGIIGLVHRLSDLKAKQIARGLKNLHAGQPCSRRRSLENNGSRVSGGCVKEQVCEGLDMESTTDKWSCKRRELGRRLEI